MSANINAYIGREAAWHNLGTVKGKHFTWADAVADGLDYDVFKSQLRDGLGRPVNAWGTFRWNRADKLAGRKDAAIFLAPVGKDYTIVHHNLGGAVVDDLMGQRAGAHYETAGALGLGETVWGLADLGLRMHVGDDEIKSYLLFVMGHDGNTGILFTNCDERVVCRNTLKRALSEKARAQFRIRHTKSAHAKIEDARAALASLEDDNMTMEAKLKFLASRRVNREAMETIFNRLFPVRKNEATGETVAQGRRNNVLADILTRYESNDGNAFIEQRGTAYNLLNAITEHVDHARATRGDAVKGRAESALFGSGADLKVNALDLILAEAEKLPPVRMAIPVTDFASIGLNVR